MLLGEQLMKIQRGLLIALLAISYSSVVLAVGETSVKKGRYEVLYSVFNTTFLEPETAKAIGVKRAKNLALINISLREYLADGTSIPVGAKQINATWFNLLHKNKMAFKEVKEPDAIYYLAKFKISNDNEKIIIEAYVTPEGSNDPIKVKFQHHFYLN
jgi:uncharacterized protein YggU (UPF0235/DUF167 family)|tara:strand:+ start:24324 stop:24797 length:474 start_codon:yes stop_codon:yes gene_type:complete